MHLLIHGIGCGLIDVGNQVHLMARWAKPLARFTCTRSAPPPPKGLHTKNIFIVLLLYELDELDELFLSSHRTSYVYYLTQNRRTSENRVILV